MQTPQTSPCVTDDHCTCIDRFGGIDQVCTGTYSQASSLTVTMSIGQMPDDHGHTSSRSKTRLLSVLAGGNPALMSSLYISNSRASLNGVNVSKSGYAKGVDAYLHDVPAMPHTAAAPWRGQIHPSRSTHLTAQACGRGLHGRNCRGQHSEAHRSFTSQDKKNCPNLGDKLKRILVPNRLDVSCLDRGACHCWAEMLSCTILHSAMPL